MSKQGWLPIIVAAMVVIPLGILVVATDWGAQGPPLHFSHLLAIALTIIVAGHLLFHPRPEVEKAIEEIRRKQAEQASQLEDLAQLLPHLLSESQRAQLLRLRNEAAGECPGSAALRGDLRRLCAMGLVRLKIGRRIRQIADGATVDPADFVELTSLGAEWIESLMVVEKAERPAAKRTGGEAEEA